MTGHDGPVGQKKHLKRVGRQRQRFNPGKEKQYPLYRRLGGPQDRSERVRKISPTLGFDLRNGPAPLRVTVPTTNSEIMCTGTL